MSRKSDTCFSTRSGEPLTEYYSLDEAQQGADYAKFHYENDMTPYQCNQCGYWHLAPSDRQTPSTTCHHCTDSLGQKKQLYESNNHAKRRAEIIFNEKGIRLDIYPCPYQSGWHLTKS